LKKYLIVFLFLCYGKAAYSQVIIALLFGDKLNSGKMEFGLMVSPTLTNISNIESNYRPGVDFGLYFNIKMSDRIYLHPEAIPKLAYGAKNLAPYSTGNTDLDSLYTNGSVERVVKAIGLPLLVRYRISGSFFAEAGPQIDLITNAKDIFKTEVNENDLSYENKTKDNYTRFSVGGVVGISYKIKPGMHGMTLGLRYHCGFTDILKPDAGKQANNAWLFNVYIPVGAGKAAKQQAAK
jgi:hypothetical protein